MNNLVKHRSEKNHDVAAFHLTSPLQSIYVPDGAKQSVALSRVTHLGIGAHQDDLEFWAFQGIAECYGRDDLWFGGVTCTDGCGSSKGGDFANVSSDDLKRIRMQEQNHAAEIGDYGFIIQLGYASESVKNETCIYLVENLVEIIKATKPTVIYTHCPTDKHRTHLGVFAAVIQALRCLPIEDRPDSLIGFESWRDLDWMCDAEKIRMDVSHHDALAQCINRVFESQIEGGKRYDNAVHGRRSANATFFEPRQSDQATQVILGMDLTPLIRKESLNVVDYTCGFISQFEQDVRSELRNFFPA